MADKAHTHLARVSGNREVSPNALAARHGASLAYNRVSGNSYTASLYVGLTSLLETSDEDLTGARIGLFSYGSGCMASFFSGVVMEGYRQALDGDRHQEMLEQRRELTYTQYEHFYRFRLPTDGTDCLIPRYTAGWFRLAGLKDHKRMYEKVVEDEPAGARTHTEMVV